MSERDEMALAAVFAIKREIEALTAERDEWQSEFRCSIATVSDRDAEIEALTAERDAERDARKRLEAALRDIGGVGYAHPKDAKTLHDEAVDRARAAIGGST